jgi:tRNA(Ile)-lysidine synthase
MEIFALDTIQPFIAVAVSGGGDSMALTLLLHDWVQARGGKILALTVDHKLREDSTAEVEQVRVWLEARGIAHKILTWHGDKPATCLQERARAARYDLLLAACAEHGCTALAFAHNLEDQIETFWMRLAHGSGLGGLAGMAASRRMNGIRIIRPLLTFSRAALRTTCAAYGVSWVDDPSNENKKFLRVRLRQFESVLAAEGLTPQRLAQTLQKLEYAHAALEEVAAQVFEVCITLHPEGHATLLSSALQMHPRDIQTRVLAHVLHSIHPQDYPPDSSAMEHLRLDVLSPSFAGRTLAGCEIFPHGAMIYLCREASRQRVQILDSPLESGMLGEDGLRELKNKAGVLPQLEALPFKVRKTLPSLWRGESLVAIPCLGWTDGIDHGTDVGINSF